MEMWGNGRERVKLTGEKDYIVKLKIEYQKVCKNLNFERMRIADTSENIAINIFEEI